MPQKKRHCILNNQQIVEFSQAWSDQQSLVSARIAHPDLDDILLLLEHPPVYTLGTGSSLDFLKFDPKAKEFELHLSLIHI